MQQATKLHHIKNHEILAFNWGIVKKIMVSKFSQFAWRTSQSAHQFPFLKTCMVQGLVCNLLLLHCTELEIQGQEAEPLIFGYCMEKMRFF